MVSVVKRKNKSLLAKIIEKIKSERFPPEQCLALDIPFSDIRLGDDIANSIASRRAELRTAKHGNTDAVVTFRGSYPKK